MASTSVNQILGQVPVVEGGEITNQRAKGIFESALDQFQKATRTGPYAPEQVGDVKKAREWVEKVSEEKGSPVSDEFKKNTQNYPSGTTDLSLLQGAVRLSLIVLVAAVGFVALMQIMPVNPSKIVKAVK